jgi:hypothetical protein
MRIGIIGSRSWDDWPLFRQHVRAWQRKYPDLHIVSGWCLEGADAMAELYAKTYRVPFTVYPAKWRKADGSLDRGAGFIRNGLIAEDSDILLAFWDLKSGGTADACRKALQIPIPVWVVAPDGQVSHASELVRAYREKAYPDPLFEPDTSRCTLSRCQLHRMMA